VRNVVRPTDIRKHLTGLTPRNGFTALMARELRSTPHDHTPRPRTLPPLTSAGPDQLTFKLSQAAKDGQHEASMSRRGVRPGISQRAEARALLSDGIQDVEKVTGRSGQAIEPRDHENVAPIQRF
jgi:hypothetical protein